MFFELCILIPMMLLCVILAFIASDIEPIKSKPFRSWMAFALLIYTAFCMQQVFQVL
jgi:hypothetical protein